MKIRPKSSELIQAQVGEFGRAANLDFDQRKAIAKNMGDLATTGPIDLVHQESRMQLKHLQSSDEQEPYNQWDDNPNMEARLRQEKVRVTRDTSETVVPYASYVDFLRKGGNQRREELRFGEKMLEAYPEFKPYVDHLVHEITTLKEPEEHDNYLGKGNNAKAFWFEHNDKKYVAKIPHSFKTDAPSEAHSANEVAAFAIGNKIEGLQHMTAASPDSSIIITELLPGKNFWDLSPEEIAAITPEQIEAAKRLLTQMYDQGLVIDPKANNLMYNPATGIHMLDYQRPTDPPTPQDTQVAINHLMKTLRKSSESSP